jgi:Domain of unknown function (DUF4262)
MMCKGATRDEVRQNLYLQICTNGFALVPVGRGWDDNGWAYTLGLVDSHNHPELVVAGVPLGKAVTVLDQLATSVLDGTRYDTSDRAAAFNAEIGFAEVRALHIRRGLMDGWIDYYGAAGRRDLDLRVLQVVLPDGTRCHEHQRSQPRLDSTRHVSFDGLNRETRRRHPRPQRK